MTNNQSFAICYNSWSLFFLRHAWLCVPFRVCEAVLADAQRYQVIKMWKLRVKYMGSYIIVYIELCKWVGYRTKGCIPRDLPFEWIVKYELIPIFCYCYFQQRQISLYIVFWYFDICKILSKAKKNLPDPFDKYIEERSTHQQWNQAIIRLQASGILLSAKMRQSIGIFRYSSAS